MPAGGRGFLHGSGRKVGAESTEATEFMRERTEELRPRVTGGSEETFRLRLRKPKPQRPTGPKGGRTR